MRRGGGWRREGAPPSSTVALKFFLVDLIDFNRSHRFLSVSLSHIRGAEFPSAAREEGFAYLPSKGISVGAVTHSIGCLFVEKEKGGGNGKVKRRP